MGRPASPRGYQPGAKLRRAATTEQGERGVELVAQQVQRARHAQASAGGEAEQRDATLAEMPHWTRPPGLAPRFVATGHGMFTFKAETGLVLIGHSGVWGAKMLAAPATGFFFSGTVNRRSAKAEWMIEIAEAVAATLSG